METKKTYILVADDEEIMRNLFTDLLTEEGYEVITAKSGVEAVKEAKETDFAIAFLDVHMPVMNGVQTLREIKKISPKTVVAMTDSFPDILIEESRKEGAITCLQKPFEIKDLFNIIETFVGKAERV